MKSDNNRNILLDALSAIQTTSVGPIETKRKFGSSQRVPFEFHECAFNDRRDTFYAHQQYDVFENTLTVFTQQWIGIRAAAGSFPGHKLAVSKDVTFDKPLRDYTLNRVQGLGIEQIVVHGFSPGLEAFVKLVAHAMPEIRIFGVWHGTLAAWNAADEVSLAHRYLELADKSYFRKIHFLKRGMHIIHAKAHEPLLPNMVPNTQVKRLALPFSRNGDLSVIFASWNNTWKNFYTNVHAAAYSELVKRILTFNDVSASSKLEKKVKRIVFPGREKFFKILAGCDAVLNVTIVDCHPMVELEALSVGTPAFRSNLDLDFGESHNYTRLFTVTQNHNPVAIADALAVVNNVPTQDITDIISNYSALVNETSVSRYRDFLEG